MRASVARLTSAHRLGRLQSNDETAVKMAVRMSWWEERRE